MMMMSRKMAVDSTENTPRGRYLAGEGRLDCLCAPREGNYTNEACNGAATLMTMMATASALCTPPSNSIICSATTTTTNTTTTTPTIDVLTLLHQYQSHHAIANDHLKSCFWNITKARRGRSYQTIASGGGKLEYTPEDVREELVAQALLEWKTKTTINKNAKNCDNKNNNNNNDNIAVVDHDDDGKFVLHLDGMNAMMLQQKEENKNFISDSGGGGGSGGAEEEIPIMGLRRRRGKGEGEGNEWTTETNILGNDDKYPQDRLLNDPLTLFGVPHPALRVAQSKSRDALKYYVEMANLAREIIALIDQHDASSSSSSGEREEYRMERE